MNEKELAADLQASAGDPTDWEIEEPKDRASETRPKRKLSAMISVRLSPDELELVQRRADQVGQSVSGYVRKLVLEDAREESHSVSNVHVTVDAKSYAGIVGEPPVFIYTTAYAAEAQRRTLTTSSYADGS